jgi:uncharacterized membrane protein (DUF106 family)
MRLIGLLTAFILFVAVGSYAQAFAAEQVDLKKATEQKKSVEATLQAFLAAQERGDSKEAKRLQDLLFGQSEELTETLHATNK